MPKYKLQNPENPAKELVDLLKSKGVNPKDCDDVALTILWMFIQCGGYQLENAIESLSDDEVDYEW